MIGVLVSGEGTNLQALLDAGLPVHAVATNRPSCRALERAEAAGVSTGEFPLEQYASREERDAAMAAWLEHRGVELVVCAGYMHLLTAAFLGRFPGRIVNVHPSLLPEFPGVRAIDDALAAGVETTGVTVHVVDQGLDTGPVIAQQPVPVEPRETLAERIHAAEHELLPRVVGELSSRPWPAPASAGRSPAPPAPGAAGGTSLSGPVLDHTVPSGLAPPAAPQEREDECAR